MAQRYDQIYEICKNEKKLCEWSTNLGLLGYFGGLCKNAMQETFSYGKTHPSVKMAYVADAAIKPAEGKSPYESIHGFERRTYR